MVLCLRMDKPLEVTNKRCWFEKVTGSDDWVTDSLTPQLVSDSLLTSKSVCLLSLTCTSLFTQVSITDIIIMSFRH